MNTYNSHQSKRMEAMHEAELATFWRRAAAFMLDLFVMSILFAILVGSLMLLLLRLGAALQ